MSNTQVDDTDTPYGDTMNPKKIDLDNPRPVEEIHKEINNIPAYWGYGFFGEHDLFMELTAAYAEQDRDQWGKLEEQYPEVTDQL